MDVDIAASVHILMMLPIKISCVNEVHGTEWSDLIGQRVPVILVRRDFPDFNHRVSLMLPHIMVGKCDYFLVEGAPGIGSI